MTPVHLFPVLLLARLATVGDLATAFANFQRADAGVRLLPAKYVAIGTAPLKPLPLILKSHWSIF